MLDRVEIRNFKRFEHVEVELGEAVVFIGPNNSGKTTAIQALALWEMGLKRWWEKRGESTPKKRPGVTLNRRDLVALPVPDAKLLWRDLHVRDVRREDGKTKTSNVCIEISVSGVSDGRRWTCALEFDYANPESLYCRPARQPDGDPDARLPVPEIALETRVAYMPPMSGLAASETALPPGAIQVRLGEGRTAEVLRNLCYQIASEQERRADWLALTKDIHRLFGVHIQPPRYLAERGEIEMTYEDNGVTLDLSSSGRGLQQTLLLLTYLYLNPGSVILLDEPDAHLEILRQRQIYQVLTDAAKRRNCQIIAASHSEVLLNEAAGRDVVVAFVGRPHRIDDQGTQVLKALRSLGFEQYLQAEQAGWVLYLEGSTDLAILRAWAETLRHPAYRHLERPFVKYIENQPQKARDHFNGLREAKMDLKGVLLVDHMERELQAQGPIREMMWLRREIENYFCSPAVLRAYAASLGVDDARADGPLFERAHEAHYLEVMNRVLEDEVSPAALRDPGHALWTQEKVSDGLLARIFKRFYADLDLPNRMRKADYHVLVDHVEAEDIPSEVADKLDAIVEVAALARPTVELG